MNKRLVSPFLLAAVLVATPSLALAQSQGPDPWNNQNQHARDQWKRDHDRQGDRDANRGRDQQRGDADDRRDRDDRGNNGRWNNGNYNGGNNGRWNNGNYNGGNNGRWNNGTYNGGYNGGYNRSGEISGIVGGYSPFNLDLRSGQHVNLHQGTVINPTGITLSPGMRVSIYGHPNGDGTFEADRIDVGTGNGGYNGYNGYGR